ncbi:hypothetical protein [Natrarchaeobaculum aegyptiacum]|nr:hypothetical protein [Natrarchaeobaculum aegyptiacum]
MSESDSDLPEWAIPLDVDILEEMRSEDVFAPEHIVEADICRGPQAAHRCRQLADHGLLTKHMTGVYDLTDLGEQVLEGERSLAEIDPEDE